MPLQLQTVPYGPFTKGVLDRAHASQPLTGAARALTNFRLTGANRLSIRDGTRVVVTLKDDAGTPADITSVCAIVAFADGCLVVGHSTATDKAYLYRLNATLDTWTASDGSTSTDATPEPVGVLWTSIPDPPDVTVAEGLGVAYICHTTGADASTLSFPMKSFTDASQAIATVTSDLDGDASAEDCYFLGCVSFQQHLWAWGFGSGTTASDSYRPELARFSQPNFDTSPKLFAAADSITVGNRVRSLREGIVGGFVAGECLYLGAPYLVSRVTGYGRDSWFKQPLDDSYGFVGPKCAVAVGGVLYYWSPRGPMRVNATDLPEPLFDPIANAVESVVNPASVIAAFDSPTDTVIFAFDTGAGVRTWAGFDVRREVWLGPANDFGLVLRAMGTVSPIFASSAAPGLGPTAAPTVVSTTSIGTSTALATWTNGDHTSPTSVEIRQQGGSTWTAHVVSAGTTTFTFTGLSSDVAYEWRVAHVRDGITSTYSGPVTASQFTTLASDVGLLPPTNPAITDTDDDGNQQLTYTNHANLHVTWTNSGESGVSTAVELSTDGTSYSQVRSVSPGVSSCTIIASSTGDYFVRMRHTRTAYTSSAYTTPVDVSVTVT